MNAWRIEPFIEASPFVGGWLLHLRETVSTNDLALNTQELLKRNGLVILADTQSGGRGRRGRKWCSSVKGNLYATFILHDTFSPPLLPYITLLIGLSLYETIVDLGIANCSIKWPNDCLINDRKVAGVLVESKEVDPGTAAMAIGIGVNLKGGLDSFPKELHKKATTIELETGKDIDRTRFLKELLGHTNGLLNEYSNAGAKPILDRWIGASSSIGRELLVREGSDSVRGEMVGLSEEGFLLLRVEDGQIIKIISGDVEFL